MAVSYAPVCLYFGTFNPIHIGHLLIAQAALGQWGQALGFEQVAFVPAGQPPHRHQESNLLVARHRLNLVHLATADNPAFQVWDVECRQPGLSYTLDTIRLLQQQGRIPDSRIPMIIGSDALAHLAQWKEPQALSERVHFLQAPRPETPFIESLTLHSQAHPLRTSRIEMPPLSLSSSWIRQTLQQDPTTQALRYALPERARQYIRDNRLYTTPSPTEQHQTSE